MNFNWDKAIDSLQLYMLWFVVFVMVICVGALILFDTLAGAGIMIYLTNGNIPASAIISLATSGLLISLMVIGYTLTQNKKSFELGWVVLTISFAVYCLDVYFDSLTADYLRFGQVIVLKEISNPTIHFLFRALIGGISTVGEPLAMSIILGMSVLKAIIIKAIPETMRTSQTPTKMYQHQTQKPHRPDAGNGEIPEFLRQHMMKGKRK